MRAGQVVSSCLGQRLQTRDEHRDIILRRLPAQFAVGDRFAQRLEVELRRSASARSRSIPSSRSSPRTSIAPSVTSTRVEPVGKANWCSW